MLNHTYYPFNSREYLATFKKTVAMHEVFLCRLANHPVFRNDHNFRVFLEYEQDVSFLLMHIIFQVKKNIFECSFLSEVKTKKKS